MVRFSLSAMVISALSSLTTADTGPRSVFFSIPPAGASSRCVFPPPQEATPRTHSADTARITGIYVLSNKETPGLGNKIDDVRWTGQFAGKSAAGPLVVRKAKTTDENAIQAITGATISSEAVTGIVNSTVAALRNTLAAAARK